MMWRLYGEAWFVGCITKYVLRYKKKNGIEDLKKAQHYLEKLIELETSKKEEVCKHNDLREDCPICRDPNCTEPGGKH